MPARENIEFVYVASPGIVLIGIAGDPILIFEDRPQQKMVARPIFRER